jgi:hypothetical protein
LGGLKYEKQKKRENGEGFFRTFVKARAVAFCRAGFAQSFSVEIDIISM